VATACVLLGFLLGSIPSGVLLARLAGVDPRRGGSGNIGATNVARLAGLRFGIATLLADAGKGAAAVLVARLTGQSETVAASAGLAAVLGHLYSPSLGFRGGKGVATSAGSLLVLVPAAALGCIATFAVVLGFDRRVSVASVSGALVAPIASGLLQGWATPSTAAATAMALLVVTRHRSNLRRLLAGTEPRI